jgi:Cu+-exporting ATPase
LQIEPGELTLKAEQLRAVCETAMLLAIGRKPAGIISVADPIKQSSAEAVSLLKADGVRIVMLT